MNHDYDNDERSSTPRHLTPGVIWGNVVGTIGLFVVLGGSLLGVVNDNQSLHSQTDKRVAVIETQLSANHERDIDLRAQMQRQLTSMEGKLDKILDRELNRSQH